MGEMMKTFLKTALATMALIVAFNYPATPVHAGSACGAHEGKTVFHCRIDGSSREVSVCALPGGDYLYVYGRPGRAELELKRSPRAVEYTPWTGIGRYLWARLGFRNGAYFYDVGFSVDRLTENARAEGQVEIYKGNRNSPISTKYCRPGSVVSRLDEIWNRFE